MTSAEEREKIVGSALDAMADRPLDLAKAITGLALIREFDFPFPPLVWLHNHLESAAPNDEIEHKIGLALRSWDRRDASSWCSGTQPFSVERRLWIYNCLKLPKNLSALLDTRLPRFVQSDMPLVVAEKHETWYFGQRQEGRFYWDSYAKYLANEKRWDTNAISRLDLATDSVLSEITDPRRKAAYQTKGLVVGYVQSGKTTHFTGVLAKAADAGYKLIIVLAGTLDILRSQTQRRVDKELIGREILGPTSSYAEDPDWLRFISFGFRPSENEYFDWERLTGAQDFQNLGEATAALSFERQDKSRAFNDELNLRHAPVRVLIIKKNAGILDRLANALKKDRIRPQLKEVPTLIVDDESDQASINTVDPKKRPKDKLSKEEQREVKTRTSINAAITGLLSTLPRAQYVGYTATPFANVLINADDAEDLFPKDFVITLPRPKGYMGVASFYDLDGEKKGFASNRAAFVRDVVGDDSATENLQKALDSFVLAGAIKLYRKNANPEEAKDGRYDHHTMLVHHSSQQKVHEKDAEKIEQVWDNCEFRSATGRARLKKLFEEDFAPTSRAQEPKHLLPASFAKLEKFIDECVDNLEANKTVRIVNGENKDDTPNFEKGGVWSILVGGAKLSRGYTVEGLTTSYFRRVARATDTLMQMGRWFGFRPGYRDLVRLFIGRDERIGSKSPKDQTKSKRKARTLDLYEAFRAMCLDEEEFRAEVEKNLAAGIRPIDLPPLVPSHLRALAPTAKNKMFNAELTFRNVGETRVERTLAPNDQKTAALNEHRAIDLLRMASLKEEEFRFRHHDDETISELEMLVGEVSPDRMRKFLKDYQWETGEEILKDELVYLEGKYGDPCIDRWLVLVPRLKGAQAVWPPKATKVLPTQVRYRKRIGQRYGSISDPTDVKVANYLAGFGGDAITPLSKTFRTYLQPKTAVLLLYPVRDDRTESFVSVLFGLQLPRNQIRRRLGWIVKVKGKNGEPPPAVVPKSKTG